MSQPPPPPPDVSGVGPNWYITDTWTNTLVPAISSAQTQYDADKAALDAFTPIYDADFQALQNLLAQPDPIATDTAAVQARKDAVQDARDLLSSDRDHLLQLLAQVQADAAALVTAKTNAETYVDSLSDTDFESFVDELKDEIGKNLTLAETVPTGFDTALLSANSTREAARAQFLSALTAFQEAEKTLSDDRVTLTSLQGEELLAEADARIQYYQTEIDQNAIGPIQQKLQDDTNALGTGDPRVSQLQTIYNDVNVVRTALNKVTQDLRNVPINFTQLAIDQAALVAARAQLVADEAALPPAPFPLNNNTFLADFANLETAFNKVVTDQTTLQSDQATVTSLRTQVTNQTSLVANDVLARDSAKSTLESKFNAYNTAINDMLNVLTQAGNLAETSPQTFLDDLHNAQQQAIDLQAAALQQAIDDDHNLNVAHFLQYPDVNPVIEQAISAVFTAAASASSNALNSSLAKPPNVVSQINFPELPAGRNLTIGEMMAFISLVQVMLAQLLQSLRQSDDNVNMLRFLLFGISSGRSSTANALSYQWESVLHAADIKYNQDVATDNSVNSHDRVDKINEILADLPEINDVIEQLNKEIDDQNKRGVDIVRDLNSSNQIATDTINQIQQAEPDAYNANNIQNQDTNLTYPASGTVPPAFPAPLQLDHLPLMDPTKIIVPATLPTDPPDDIGAVPLAVPPGDIPVPQADVDKINETIAYIDNIIYPLLPRLQRAGLDLNLIDPLFMRPYIPVRTASDVIDFSTITSFILLFIFLILIMITQSSSEKTGNQIPTNFFATLASISGKPGETGTVGQAGDTGTSPSILSANLFTAAGNIGQALSAVLNSSNFSNLFAQILSQASLIGGLASLTKLPTSIDNYSQLGIVRSDASTAVGETADARVDLENGLPTLTPEQLAAANAAVGQLVNASNNIPLLQQGILSLLKAAGPQELSSDEIQQLISILLFIIQLLSLLVAALIAAAAGGKVNIDEIVNAAINAPGNAANANNLQSLQLHQTTTDLQALGVQNLPSLTSSPEEFVSNFLNAVTPELTPAEQNGFAAQVTTVFQDKGITLNTNVPIGNAVQEALSGVTDDNVKNDILHQLNQIAQQEGSQLRSEILSDDTRRSSIASQVIAANNIAFSNLDSDTVKRINDALNAQAPQIAGLSENDRNTLVLAVAKGIITPDQAKSFVDTFLQQEATSKNPVVGLILGLAIQSKQGLTQPTIPRVGTPATEPGTPGQLPDATSLLINSLTALSRQATDNNFANQIISSFADSVRDQTDFFSLALNLVLQPSGVFTKNFSLRTQDHFGGGSTTPLQIPISG